MRILYIIHELYGNRMRVMRNTAESYYSAKLIYRKHLTPIKFTFGHSVVTLNTQKWTFLQKAYKLKYQQ
ncbi:MAG: hypothetical protein CBC12_12465 [Candidatus Puniceispirillum sp. TMED52]|nr:hypothetical protein [SAR116 cluster bacterium]OUU45732.1 MAG: hypothetical protein CBC12_12465 [Candidatus Puniceispirillum sp. TMED52]